MSMKIFPRQAVTAYIQTKICLFFAITAISGTAYADRTIACLKGEIQNAACTQMIINYWSHNAAMERIAREEGVEPALLKALVAQESHYNHRAVSPVKATGLTQVMYGTASDLGVRPHELFVPEVSLRTGARYLRQMYERFGQLDLALAAYNAGPGRVQRAGNQIPRIAETQNYVRKVSALYHEFKQKEQRTSASATVAHSATLSSGGAMTSTKRLGTYNNPYQSLTSNQSM